MSIDHFDFNFSGGLTIGQHGVDHNSSTFWQDAYDASNKHERGHEPSHDPRHDPINDPSHDSGTCTTASIQWVPNSGPYGGHYDTVTVPCDTYTPPDGNWTLM